MSDPSEYYRAVQITETGGLYSVHSIHFSTVDMFHHRENAELDAWLWERYLNAQCQEAHNVAHERILVWEAIREICKERGLEL